MRPGLDTIKSTTEISTLFNRGKRVHTRYFTMIYLAQDQQHDRCGRVAFIAGKKLGNAVWRNTAKRRLRSLCYELNGPFDGYDILLVARKSLTEAKYADVFYEFERALKRAGLNG